MTPLQLVETALRVMVRLTVLVPLKDNDGRPFPSEYVAALEQFILRCVGGLQQLPVVRGGWMASDGTVFIDECTPFVVTCDAERVTRLQADLDVLVRTLFVQRAVYTEICDVRLTTF
jgi:hypothetical protein